MSVRCLAWVMVCLMAMLAWGCAADKVSDGETRPGDARLEWWREARFGMFIHWGLYAIPAGEWGGRKDYGEWIRSSAQIPEAEYDRFVDQFNPTKFDAGRIVQAAKQAGMKYIVITTKHHDGFCLFDSAHTEFDVMSTPFKRDIMKELAEACRREGIRLGWYYSIMDWKHPDYLPRRDWERDRPKEGADFDRYVRYMKAQLAELLTKYGEIGVLWFDGQWEGTWDHARGKDMYAYVRGLQPRIIVNNRVDKGGGEFGITREGYMGDFGTPEQEIPPMGLPDVDWETCMTMNDHWGYCRADQNWKSATDLIRKLSDIASKGGNFLLNVGPTAEGEIPAASLARLREIGAWMERHGEAIYGTRAGPLGLPKWGRSTRKVVDKTDGPPMTRLYLHVWEWPRNGRLVVEGLYNEVLGASLLSWPDGPSLNVSREGSGGENLVIALPPAAPDEHVSVVVLDVVGKPDVAHAPELEAFADIFVETVDVKVKAGRENVEYRYTLDGSEPTARSPLVGKVVKIGDSATMKVKAFRGGKAVSPTASRAFTKVACRPGVNIFAAEPGLKADYYEGDWDRLPDFETMEPKRTSVATSFARQPRDVDDKYAFRFRGYINIPKDGVYRFFTNSDDGSRLWIGEQLVVDNDGLHSASEKSGVIALAAGTHFFTVAMFEKSGGDELQVMWEGPGIRKEEVPWAVFVRDP
ncbi:MAG: alpha-L-fucosidase [Phycisphaeraceae bacterium]|nr:alpha-L-fucosidase [Phycisphaeraceae bacterium]